MEQAKIEFPKGKQFGTVIVFNKRMTEAECKAIVEQLDKQGVLEGGYYRGGVPTVTAFNPAYGGPVWYVP